MSKLSVQIGMTKEMNRWNVQNEMSMECNKF